MTERLDPRLHAYRPDLADRRLEGRVRSDRYVSGAPGLTTVGAAPLRARPDPTAPAAATLLHGEPVWIFDTSGGWRWVQSHWDGYVGYVAEPDIAQLGGDAEAGRGSGGALDDPQRDARVVGVLRTHLYPKPDFKTAPLGWAPFGGRLRVTSDQDGRFVQTISGAWVVESHLAAPGPVADWVAEAERFVGSPYLWGGETSDGVDCSGLIHIALQRAGVACPRDSDMQAAALGGALSDDAAPRRGDLIFWAGHVGVLCDPQTLLHAHAGAMLCEREPVNEAILRIRDAGFGEVTGRRRLAMSV